MNGCIDRMKQNKSERERQKISYTIIYMWSRKYDTNELVYEMETDSQTQRADLWLPWGRMGWEFEISIYKLIQNG